MNSFLEVGCYLVTKLRIHKLPFFNLHIYYILTFQKNQILNRKGQYKTAPIIKLNPSIVQEIAELPYVLFQN